jgi:hypothetical protein
VYTPPRAHRFCTRRPLRHPPAAMASGEDMLSFDFEPMLQTFMPPDATRKRGHDVCL